MSHRQKGQDEDSGCPLPAPRPGDLTGPTVPSMPLGGPGRRDPFKAEGGGAGQLTPASGDAVWGFLKGLGAGMLQGDYPASAEFGTAMSRDRRLQGGGWATRGADNWDRRQTEAPQVGP